MRSEQSGSFDLIKLFPTIREFLTSPSETTKPIRPTFSSNIPRRRINPNIVPSLPSPDTIIQTRKAQTTPQGRLATQAIRRRQMRRPTPESGKRR